MIAEPIFRGTRAHRLLLEYDDVRSGTFTPLQHVPDDKTVVILDEQAAPSPTFIG